MSTSKKTAKKARNRYLVGFDLGGTKMMAGVFDSRFRLLGTARKRTKCEGDGRAGMARIIQVIHEALESAKVSPSRVAAIGIGSPGPLDLNKGVILNTPNLGWKNVPLRRALQRAFKCPVVVANDVDAGTYGEYRFGAARKARTVVGIFPGTGIGGAAIYDGRLIRGRTASCMEIGHLRVQPGGRLCGCGQRGCLETVASRPAISAEAAAAALRGEAPHLLKSAGTELSKIRSSELRAAVDAGDKVVAEIVRTAGRHIGTAAGQVINLLAPDMVVLGGGLVEALGDLILPECRHAADASVMSPFRHSYHIVESKLGDLAVLHGAAALAEEELNG